MATGGQTGVQQMRRPIGRELATLSRRRVLLMVTAMPAALGACTAIELPDPSGSMAERGKTTASDLAQVTASAMRDSGEQTRFFGTDLKAKGILPVWVTIKNIAPSDMLVFESDTLKVAANGAAMGASRRALSPVNTSGEVATALVGAALISLPLMLISAKMLKDSLAIKRNMMLRQLYSRTLLPNETADGFVYAALPAEGQISDVYSVTLVIQRIGPGGARTPSSYQLEI